MRAKLSTAAIVETAAKIADENGLDTVTLTYIAAKLNIKKQSLYNHIDSLFHLKCELVIYANAHLKQYLTHAAIGQSRDDAVLEVAKAYRQFALIFPGQYQAIISLAWECKEDEKFKAASRDLMDVLFKVLSQYQLRDEYLTHAVRGLRSIMHGFVSLEASGWFHQPITKEDSYLLLVQTFIYGVEAVEKE
ncbi:TetR/AcrR family transcriptional regulator [Pectinatus haikarae]|uniref:AcrR family transcriptional regulator n=1 Tax=Pectinatus haikarae TaxID=349096 RepID=A0ABT9Y7V8_9FIRM|nr:TetR-like C-terminal domain-containing protein [Pectinatus haikarae]MDQ0203920.1 AcrR family transcriptional regulator [Pectinatus haikarae]